MYGTWFGIAEVRTAETGEWSLLTPVMHGENGGSVVGVPLNQTVMLPVLAIDVPDAETLGVSIDGKVLCNFDGVRSWAIPTRHLIEDEHGAQSE